MRKGKKQHYFCMQLQNSGEYVTFKTEPKKSIIENITESPQTGMLATILVSLICISSLGGVVYYRKKVKN